MINLERIPWRCRLSAFECFLALLGALVAAPALVAVALAAWRRLSGNPPDSLLVQALLYVVPAAVALSVCGAVRPRGNLLRKLGIRALRFRDFRTVVAGCLVIWGIGNWLIGSFWRDLLAFCKIDFAETQNLVMAAISMSGWRLAVLAVLVALVIPAVEELVFRRLLYGLFRPLGGVVALGLTATLFGCVHFFLLGLPSLIFMGVVFQIAFLTSRNLLVPFMIHMIINGAVLLMLPIWD